MYLITVSPNIDTSQYLMTGTACNRPELADKPHDNGFKSNPVCPDMDQVNSSNYQVQSDITDCVYLSDPSYIKRTPASLHKGNIKLDAPRENDVDKDDDKDDNTDDSNGNAMYSNQHPNEWMSTMNSAIDTSVAEEVNLYTGMGIEEDNYNGETEETEFGSSNSIASASSWQYYQPSENDIPEILINDNAIPSYEFQPRLYKSHSNVNQKFYSGSDFSTSEYNSDSSSYYTNEASDFNLLDENPILNTYTLPNLNTHQSDSNSLNSFELTQSDYNLDRMESLELSVVTSGAYSESTISLGPTFPSSRSHPEFTLRPNNDLISSSASSPDLQRPIGPSTPRRKIPPLSSDSTVVNEPPVEQQPSVELQQLFGDMEADEDE